MYRLDHHQDESLRFKLDSDSTKGHRFTVVLGPNGTGKSQLLRSIAEKYRVGSAKSEEQALDPADTRPEDRPSRLLVLSNLVTDVFVNTSKRQDAYRYLGLRQASNNTSTGALRDVTSAAILECFKFSDETHRLGPVLDALGGDQFFAGFERTRARSKAAQDEFKLVSRFIDGLELDDSRSHYASSEALLNELRHFDASIPRTSKVFDFDAPELAFFWSISARFQLEPLDLIRLLRRLGFANVRIHLRLGDRDVDLDALSTGQLLLLSTFARVAANAAPRSLVIIDEPEAGLHPNWQSAWIPLMRATIPAEYGCHLFIATHSPYLVSDADDVLVPGEEWGTFVPFNEPYQGRSVENILYRVFGARVAGNLMVENDLRTLVQLISHGSVLPSSDQLEQAAGALRRLRGMQGEDTQDLNLIIAQAEKVLAR